MVILSSGVTGGVMVKYLLLCSHFRFPPEADSSYDKLLWGF